MRAHRLADCFWLSAAFAAPNDGAALVDDADRGGLKRHVKADVVLLIHGNASERWLPAEATGQSAPDPRRDYAMSRPALGRAPRASAVQGVAQRPRRFAPARSAPDSASTVLCSTARRGFSASYRALDSR